ncbi:MAG TPA: hypothetical protein VMU59_05030 [Caulobacteraceae bacterium]|nr:hypothetical protein [Caulobacteraceae bacterium]
MIRALIAGSVVACALGVAAGVNLKPGVHPDGPDLRGAADTLVKFAAPPAEARGVDDQYLDSSSADAQPQAEQVLYVRWDGRWVTPAERDAARAQVMAALQDQPMTTPAGNGGEATDPPPPPLVVSLNTTMVRATP